MRALKGKMTSAFDSFLYVSGEEAVVAGPLFGLCSAGPLNVLYGSCRPDGSLLLVGSVWENTASTAVSFY
jgi:hypothetical protein